MRVNQSAVKDFFFKKNIHLECPICHHDKISFRDTTIFVTDSKDNDAITTNGYSHPYAVADCANCNYAMLFATYPMGILK